MEMLKEMAIFAQVVDSGGFSAAGRQLELTTSAVSRHVSRLEAHMGGRLLQRTTRSLSLTELGQQVYAACSRMVSTAREVHALAGSYSARPNGVIRVSAPIVLGQVWLAPKLPGFLARYPEVNVELQLVDRKIDLIEEGVDLAIRIATELAPGLVARPLGPVRYVLVATPRYLATHGEPKAPQDLPQHQCSYLGYARFGEAWSMRRNGEAGQRARAIAADDQQQRRPDGGGGGGRRHRLGAGLHSPRRAGAAARAAGVAGVGVRCAVRRHRACGLHARPAPGAEGAGVHRLLA